MVHNLKTKILSTILCLMMLTLSTAFVGNHKSNDSLPPRPPTVTPQSYGGTIILQLLSDVPISSNELRAVVQWQSVDGTWHNVEGWQGDFNEKLQLIWWVAPKDLGKGPFRWIVQDKTNHNEVVVESNSFQLPNRRQEVIIEISLDRQ